jgi:Tfp pilus assembly protein PilO
MSSLARRWLARARLARRIAPLSSLSRQRLLWSLRHWANILDRPGLLAIVILLLLPPFYLAAIVPAQERLAAARGSSLSLHEQIQHASRAMDGLRDTPVEQLAAFYRIFPRQSDAPLWLKKLVHLADRHGLRLNEGEYRSTPDQTGRLMRLQLLLPVKGEYRQIRRFLAAMPAEIPIIALEDVQFSRQSVADPAVEARIRLALYLEQGS